jgi:hypothetical protein
MSRIESSIWRMAMGRKKAANSLGFKGKNTAALRTGMRLAIEQRRFFLFLVTKNRMLPLGLFLPYLGIPAALDNHAELKVRAALGALIICLTSLVCLSEIVFLHARFGWMLRRTERRKRRREGYSFLQTPTLS